MATTARTQRRKNWVCLASRSLVLGLLLGLSPGSHGAEQHAEPEPPPEPKTLFHRREIGIWKRYWPVTSWAPDSHQICFQNVVRDRVQLYIVDIESNAVRLLSDGTSNDGHPSWHPNGDRILFASDRDGPLAAYELHLQTRRISLVRRERADIAFPTYSPDGEKIAYCVEASANPRTRTLNVLDFAHGKRKVLQAPKRGMGWPAWSPDGSRILFHCLDDNGWNNIYEITVATGARRAVTKNRSNDTWSPAFSPDGTRFLFSEGAETDPFGQYVNYEIYERGADELDKTRLSYAWMADTDARISPDGKRISFTSSRTGYLELYLLDADGTKIHQLTQQPDTELTRRIRRYGMDEALDTHRKMRRSDPFVLLFSEAAGVQTMHRLLASGATDDALRFGRVFSDSYPESGRAHESLGRALFAAGKRDKALEAYRRALAINPVSLDAVGMLGTETYLQLLRSKGTLRARQSDANRMAYRMLRAGNGSGALSLFRAIAEENPTSFNAHDSLAEALMLFGDVEGARRHYKKSIALNPGNDNARLQLRCLGD